MVNKKLIDQLRDQAVKTLIDEMDEIALAALAAGVPISDLRITSLPNDLIGYGRGIYGQCIYIGALAVPVTIKLY